MENTDKNHSSTEEELQELERNSDHLSRVLHSFERQSLFATSQKARLEDLMQRKSCRKWKPEKTARMVRRLVAASKEQEQAVNAIDYLRAKLEQLASPAKTQEDTSTVVGL